MASKREEFEKLKKDIKKIMGDKANLLELPASGLKAAKDEDDAWNKFQDALSKAEDELLGWKNATAAKANAFEQWGDKIEASNLDCDKSAADYKKKRAEAQKLIDIFFKDYSVGFGKLQQDAKELDRHMRNIYNYKPSKV